MRISYIRVSTVEQNEGRQVKAMEELGIEKMYIDKCSGKDTNRPQFEEMNKFIDAFVEINKQSEEKQGLSIYIHDFSRLARSTKDLLEMIEDYEGKGVKLISLKENLDTSTANGKLMVTMLGAINEFERANMLERQKEGIAIARAEGKYQGRKKVELPSNWEEVYPKWKSREMTSNNAMDLLGLKRTTFYKLIKDYEATN